MLTRPSSCALVACGLGVEMNGGTFALGNEWRSYNTSSSVMNANTSPMWHAHARPSIEHLPARPLHRRRLGTQLESVVFGCKSVVSRLPDQLRTCFSQWDLSESVILMDPTEGIRLVAALGAEMHRFPRALP